MIENNIIHADLSDLELELKLYQKVLTYQIHRCDLLKYNSSTLSGE